MLIHELSIENIKELNNSILNKLDKATSLESAAKIFIDKIYNTFSESIVLIRFFAVIDFHNLSEEKQILVNNLYYKFGLSENLDKNDSILILLSEEGIGKKWYTASNLDKYQVIPLKLLEYKLGPGTIKNILTKTIDEKVTIYFIENALTSRNNAGEKIFKEQAFAEKYNINSIFAFGGRYFSNREYMKESVIALIYTNEKLTESHAIQFFVFSNVFKDKTMYLVKNNFYFEQT